MIISYFEFDRDFEIYKKERARLYKRHEGLQYYDMYCEQNSLEEKEVKKPKDLVKIDEVPYIDQVSIGDSRFVIKRKSCLQAIITDTWLFHSNKIHLSNEKSEIVKIKSNKSSDVKHCQETYRKDFSMGDGKDYENKQISTKDKSCKKCKKNKNSVDKDGNIILFEICKICNKKKQIYKEEKHRNKSSINEFQDLSHKIKRKIKTNEKNKIHNTNEQCKQNINNLNNINKANNSKNNKNKKKHIEKSLKKSNCSISEISIVLQNQNKSANLNEDTLIYTPIENTKENENKKITTKENNCKKCKQFINIVDKEGIFVDICKNCNMKKQINKEKQHITQSTINKRHKSKVNQNKNELHFNNEINHETKRKRKENEKNKIHNTNEQCKQNINNLNNINKANNSKNNKNKKKHIEKSLKKSNCLISEISIVLPNQNKSAKEDAPL